MSTNDRPPRNRLLRPILYRLLDALYLQLDKAETLRTGNLRLIPGRVHRRGGKCSYAEWAHVIGTFQSLMYMHLESKIDNAVLDVGCGTGLLAIAAEPFLGAHGQYTGIDVQRATIEFCRRHYPCRRYRFLHLDANHPVYAQGQTRARRPWPVAGGVFHLVTALSVWTHFNEPDAFFYMQEVGRVLRPGGRAIITFFVLDRLYEQTIGARASGTGMYHRTPRKRWIFDRPAYDSRAWFCPDWAHLPEDAIGVNEEGISRLLRRANLHVVAKYDGNWKEVPGVFFQDVLVLQKGARAASRVAC